MWLAPEKLRWLLQRGFKMLLLPVPGAWCSVTAKHSELPVLWVAAHNLETIQLVASEMQRQNVALETQYTSQDPNLLGCTILHSFNGGTFQSTENAVQVTRWLFTLPVPPDIHARRVVSQTTAIQEAFIYGGTHVVRPWRFICALIEAGADLFDPWPDTKSLQDHACAALCARRRYLPTLDHIEMVLDLVRNDDAPSSEPAASLRCACKNATRTVCKFVDTTFGRDDTAHPLLQFRPLIELIAAYNYI
jgi:hypothetical protein